MYFLGVGLQYDFLWCGNEKSKDNDDNAKNVSGKIDVFRSLPNNLQIQELKEVKTIEIVKTYNKS